MQEKNTFFSEFALFFKKKRIKMGRKRIAGSPAYPCVKTKTSLVEPLASTKKDKYIKYIEKTICGRAAHVDRKPEILIIQVYKSFYLSFNNSNEPLTFQQI